MHAMKAASGDMPRTTAPDMVALINSIAARVESVAAQVESVAARVHTMAACAEKHYADETARSAAALMKSNEIMKAMAQGFWSRFENAQQQLPRT